MKGIEKKEGSTPGIVKVRWVEGMQFVATDSLGHSIVMDTSKKSGREASGFSPMQLLLVALGGCTGMDVVHIMRKQRQQVDGLELLVSGKRVEKQPRVYNNINVVYRVKGKSIKEVAVQRAIKLSQDKYCSVGATLSDKAKVTSNYVIHQE